MESIIVALITGGLSLIGVIITNRGSARKVQHQLEIAQAVARRMPVLEERIKVANHRIDDLEHEKEKKS